MSNRLSVGNASINYLVVLILMLAGSFVTSYVIGFGWSLWVNQGVFVAFAAVLASKNKLSWRRDYRFRRLKFGTALSSFVMGFGLWWGGVAFNIWSERFVTNLFGPQPNIVLSPIDPILMVIGFVILAPICEEILFRGYFLRAFAEQTTKPWIWSGLLFGVLHIGNGLASTLPAIIYGLVFGYIVWRSGSIWAGVLAHFGVNLNAVFLGGVFQQFVKASSFSPALLIFSSIGIIIFLLGFWWFRRGLSGQSQTEAHNQNVHWRPLHIGALIMAALVLLSLGGLDVMARMSTESDGYSSVSARGFSESLALEQINITSPSRLEFVYKLSAESIDAQIVVAAPDGNIVWSNEIAGQMGLTLDSAPVQMEIEQSGTWQIFLIGTGEDVTVEVFWKVSW